MTQVTMQKMDAALMAQLNSGAPLELRACALTVLALSDPAQKNAAIAQIERQIAAGQVTLDTARQFNDESLLLQTPGRPQRPELVGALDVPRRKTGSLEGRLGMIHALAHIEFNAINLALDVLVRFANLPDDFYWDWWRVACEEALHFSLLRAHLQRFSSDYGAYAAHNGLWEMAVATQNSLADRMAMVPRTLEARGLDACPLTREKLHQAGDVDGAAIIDLILRDGRHATQLHHRRADLNLLFTPTATIHFAVQLGATLLASNPFPPTRSRFPSAASLCNLRSNFNQPHSLSNTRAFPNASSFATLTGSRPRVLSNLRAVPNANPFPTSRVPYACEAVPNLPFGPPLRGPSCTGNNVEFNFQNANSLVKFL